MSKIFTQRDADWRMGRIVYQIFVDRFFSVDPLSKQSLYPAPKHLLPWSSSPERGKKLTEVPHYAHELDFWGGDLHGIKEKLSYLTDLGIDTLYLTPIFPAYSNHKYDTMDYRTISPEFGTMDDLKALIQATKEKNIAMILDGVFNHMSFHSPWFQDALKNPNSPYRSWFVFRENFRFPYRAWHNAPSLPELHLENPEVRHYLWTDVVQYYLNLGIAGWRLDTAIELGFRYLQELTESAHAVKKDTVIIGEINNYPASWTSVIDGTIQLPLRDWLIQTAKGNIPASLAQAQLNRYISDTGIEAMLKSWILLENHDHPRVRFDLNNLPSYHFAKYLSLTLPGNLHLYQGEEWGLNGGQDPLNREPFPWHRVGQKDPYYSLHQHMISLRKNHRALRIGDYTAMPSSQLLAFLRTTNLHQETLIVIANPSKKPVTEWLMIPDSKLRSHLPFVDLITGKKILDSWGTYLPLTVPPQTVYILQPQQNTVDGYSPTKYYFED